VVNEGSGLKAEGLGFCDPPDGCAR
jgi:hypothetical protein